MSRLIKLIKKDIEWIKFKLTDDKEIRILIKDDTRGGRKKSKVIIDCPTEIIIDSEIDYTEQEISGNF